MVVEVEVVMEVRIVVKIDEINRITEWTSRSYLESMKSLNVSTMNLLLFQKKSGMPFGRP